VKRLFISLVIFGAILMFAAVSGISSYHLHSDRASITYASPIVRVAAFLFSIAAFLCAWGIRKGKQIAWRAVFVANVLQWIFFVILGTEAVAAQYKVQPPTSETLLFAGLVALCSLPVAIYWTRRLRSEYVMAFRKDG
jgi:hypothetical protein